MNAADVKKTISVTTKITKKTKGAVELKDDEIEVQPEEKDKDESDEEAASHNDEDGFSKKQQVKFDEESDVAAESQRDHSDSIDV